MLTQTLKRFTDKVDKTSDCWNWTASCDGKGYGQFVYKGKLSRAHRVSYMLFKGEIPEGLDLDHLCRNIKCVNPEHLEAVTRSVNLQRAILWQSKKTHCPRGHEYDIITERARRCSICQKVFANARQKKYYWRQKNA